MIGALEKTLTALAMPCGLIWLAMIALVWLAWRQRQRSLLVGLVTLLVFYSLAGNGELAKVLIGRLERPYVGIDPLEQGPYDAVVVLGGGVGVATNGLAQLELSGDRAALGARLYHAGRTKQLIAMGLTVAGPHGEPRDLADEVTDIWRQWGVAEKHIVRLSGRTTREEMRSVRQLASEHPEWKRIGLVTSAWHMPRALRLSRKNDLTLDPLPADFRGAAIRWEAWLLIVPNSSGFVLNQLAGKEILARLAGQ